MVVRKRLKLPALPRGKADVVTQVKEKHRGLRDAAIEKEANTREEVPEEPVEGQPTAEEEQQTHATPETAVEGEDNEHERDVTL